MPMEIVTANLSLGVQDATVTNGQQFLSRTVPQIAFSSNSPYTGSGGSGFSWVNIAPGSTANLISAGTGNWFFFYMRVITGLAVCTIEYGAGVASTNMDLVAGGVFLFANPSAYKTNVNSIVLLQVTTGDSNAVQLEYLKAQ